MPIAPGTCLGGARPKANFTDGGRAGPGAWAGRVASCSKWARPCSELAFGARAEAVQGAALKCRPACLPATLLAPTPP